MIGKKYLEQLGSAVMTKLEVGKYYKHIDGAIVAVRAKAETTQWDTCLFVETTEDQLGLVPIDEDQKEKFEEWKEITEIEWDEQFDGL